MDAVMAATAPKLGYSHITKDRRVCGGKACIDATRIRVIDIVQAQREGYTPEQMRSLFAVTLSLAQVYSALAYADEHPQEIAADFASEASAEAEIEALRAQNLGQRGR
jgi:uncharacterized protein (DUF433 family)